MTDVSVVVHSEPPVVAQAAAARLIVRVVDAQTGQTRWPTDTTQGHMVTVGTPYAKPGMKADEATVREQLCQDLATHVARLFYDWQSEGADTGTPVK